MHIKGDLRERNLDGIYLQVKIKGKWHNRCLTDMSWEEVRQYLFETWADDPVFTPEAKIKGALRIAQHLHGRLRAIGDQLDLVIKKDE